MSQTGDFQAVTLSQQLIDVGLDPFRRRTCLSFGRNPRASSPIPEPVFVESAPLDLETIAWGDAAIEGKPSSASAPDWLLPWPTLRESRLQRSKRQSPRRQPSILLHQCRNPPARDPFWRTRYSPILLVQLHQSVWTGLFWPDSQVPQPNPPPVANRRSALKHRPQLSRRQRRLSFRTRSRSRCL